MADNSTVLTAAAAVVIDKDQQQANNKKKKALFSARRGSGSPILSVHAGFDAFLEGLLSNAHVKLVILRRRFEMLTVLERGAVRQCDDSSEGGAATVTVRKTLTPTSC
jgi:mevalonate pyrophosphate decarboxylase